MKTIVKDSFLHTLYFGCEEGFRCYLKSNTCGGFSQIPVPTTWNQKYSWLTTIRKDEINSLFETETYYIGVAKSISAIEYNPSRRSMACRTVKIH